MRMNASAGQCPHCYTNRFGRAYYIRSSNGAGSARYVVSVSPKGALATVPAGYEICESINGHVSVRLIRPRRISVAEQHLIENAMSKIRPHGYMANVKN